MCRSCFLFTPSTRVCTVDGHIGQGYPRPAPHRSIDKPPHEIHRFNSNVKIESSRRSPAEKRQAKRCRTRDLDSDLGAIGVTTIARRSCLRGRMYVLRSNNTKQNVPELVGRLVCRSLHDLASLLSVGVVKYTHHLTLGFRCRCHGKEREQSSSWFTDGNRRCFGTVFTSVLFSSDFSRQKKLGANVLSC